MPIIWILMVLINVLFTEHLFQSELKQLRTKMSHYVLKKLVKFLQRLKYSVILVSLFSFRKIFIPHNMLCLLLQNTYNWFQILKRLNNSCFCTELIKFQINSSQRRKCFKRCISQETFSDIQYSHFSSVPSGVHFPFSKTQLT